MATEFKPARKQRGNVILARDWNTTMDEVVRLGEETFPRSGGTVKGDLIADGKLGIGTTEPSATLEVNGDFKTDLAVINDGGYNKGPTDPTYAGFSHRNRTAKGNYALLQRNDGATFLNASSGTKIHFRINNNDKVTLNSDGALSFGEESQQMINLWKKEYGIGIQRRTFYFRTARHFAWYKKGSHHKDTFDAGAEGSIQMVLNEHGRLGIGTSTPSASLEVAATSTATADNQTLVGVKIDPTFDDGDKKGVQRNGLDISGMADTEGQASLLLRSGNRGDKYASNQITFGFNNTDEFRHAIKTRHHASKRVGNAIDFYVWKYLGKYNKDSKNTIGTLHTMTLAGGRVGVGLTAPAVSLDVAGVSDTEGQASMLLRSGNRSENFDSSQITFGFDNTDNCRHAIKTRHHDTDRLSNAIDFYVWKYLNENDKDGKKTIGTLHTMTLAGGHVGIGTTSPTSMLDVRGTVKAEKFEGDGSALTGITAASSSDDPWSEVTDADGDKGLQYKAGKNVIIGASHSGANLQILTKNQQAKDGDCLVLGKRDASSTNLRLGYHADYAWIQSHNEPLAINPAGGNVGIGTDNPKGALDVAGYIVMQKPDATAATELLTDMPDSSLIIGGPDGDSIAFYWKDGTGKKYQLSLTGEALT